MILHLTEQQLPVCQRAVLKREKTNKDLVVPDKNTDGEYITAIADYTGNGNNGMFATADEKFTSVTLPAKLEKIGAKVFADCGITKIEFPKTLKEIGWQHSRRIS